MKNKYLLYIDILGFANLVGESPAKVRRLYKIIEELNCHKHDAFQVIVFSDTILIYNKFDPFMKHDHEYAVMFLIEFAQNFLYSIIGKDYSFRAVLVYGEFEHSSPNNIERFFGRALVSAYSSEKNIACTGLFIDDQCQKHNSIFAVERHDDLYSFVYLNQSLDQLVSGTLGKLPVDGWLIGQTDSQWHLAKDVRLLADIYRNMRSHSDPRVRQKYLATWDYYSRRYGSLLSLLEKNSFDPNCISKNFNWSEANRRIDEGFRGAGIEPISVEDLHKLISDARKVGIEAAERKCVEKFGEPNPPPDKYYLPCGSAYIVLDIKGNSRLGRFLLKQSDSLVRARIRSDYQSPKRGLLLSIFDMHARQEMEIDEVAHEAALVVVRNRLDIDGHVESYVD